MSSSSSSSSAAKKALLNCPTIKCRDGSHLEHPSIGFGTYKVGTIPASASSAVAGGGDEEEEEEKQRSAFDCVLDALNAGYRFLECAEFYNNEESIGKAILASKVKREELFLVSKVWTTTIEKGPKAILEQFDKTCKNLQTDYLDLYLIHWPVPNLHVEAYKTLIQLKKDGKIRGIGVSNYAFEDYLELKNDNQIQPEDYPLVNQIEINPFLYRQNTISKFEKEGVIMQSYRSLRDGKAFTHPTIVSIAKAHQKTAAQILGRWCVQHGFVYIPKSVKQERMVENGQVFDFQLSKEDMSKLDSLTTDEAFQNFQTLYRKCVNRDTSKDGTLDGVKMDITID